LLNQQHQTLQSQAKKNSARFHEMFKQTQELLEENAHESHKGDAHNKLTSSGAEDEEQDDTRNTQVKRSVQNAERQLFRLKEGNLAQNRKFEEAQEEIDRCHD
jgi:hypothetical protein